FVGWAKALLRRAHHRNPRYQFWWARFALPTLQQKIGGVRAADFSLRNLPERLPDWQHRVPDQAGIFHRRLAVLHRFAVDGVADHLGEGGDAWIFGDEAMVPALLLGTDQHQLESALPDDAAAEALEHRAALAAIGRIGFRAARLA